MDPGEFSSEQDPGLLGHQCLTCRQGFMSCFSRGISYSWDYAETRNRKTSSPRHPHSRPLANVLPSFSELLPSP